MNERMDPASKSNAADEERIQAVLTELGSALPDDGFKHRLAARLANAPVPQQKPAWAWARLRMPLVLAGGCAAVLVSVAMLQPRYHGGGLAGLQKQTAARQDATAVAAGQPVTDTAEPAVKVADAEAAVPKQRSQRTTAAVNPQRERTQTEASVREASFPAPPMPLTEQERLLIKVAHRNDPEEIAMLNPVERSLQAARERAESAKFFAPAPLPEEIQQEIKAALRSQYVNTPPPQELLAQTPNRSTP